MSLLERIREALSEVARVDTSSLTLSPHTGEACSRLAGCPEVVAITGDAHYAQIGHDREADEYAISVRPVVEGPEPNVVIGSYDTLRKAVAQAARLVDRFPDFKRMISFDPREGLEDDVSREFVRRYGETSLFTKVVGEYFSREVAEVADGEDAPEFGVGAPGALDALQDLLDALPDGKRKLMQSAFGGGPVDGFEKGAFESLGEDAFAGWREAFEAGQFERASLVLDLNRGGEPGQTTRL